MKNCLVVFTVLALGCFAMPAAVMASEFSVVSMLAAYSSDEGVAGYVVQFVVEAITANPTLSIALMILSLGVPVFAFIADKTPNPIDNAMLIFLNKLLHTLGSNTSNKQPDMLSWYQLLTNRPSKWPDLLILKIGEQTAAIRDNVFRK